jgi:dTMP kinase
LSGFITFEGIEGSGKTTQVALLADALRARGYTVVTTREPGGTRLGEELRGLLLMSDVPIDPAAEAYLMTAARAQHVRDVIAPALMDGSVVICDRFADSTFAYQGGGRGLPTDVLRRLQELAIGGLIPDQTILLDLPVESGLGRRRGEGAMNRIDAETVEFHERVAAWFQHEARSGDQRWLVVDATEAPSMVHTAILEGVLHRLESDGEVRSGIGRE